MEYPESVLCCVDEPSSGRTIRRQQVGIVIENISGQENHRILNPDPMVTLDEMWSVGKEMESIAHRLLTDYGPLRAADTLTLLIARSPSEGVRGLTHLATMGASVREITARLEATNISPLSLISSDHVSVEARQSIAMAMGGDWVDAVSELGLRIVDRDMVYLDDGLVVDGSLSIYRANRFVATPDRTFVEHVFDIWDCPELRIVGNQLIVKELMRIRDCRELSWPTEVDVAELDVPGMPVAPFRRVPSPNRKRHCAK